MSIGLAIFNLIPIPPLDGSKVLMAVLSEQSYGSLMRVERYGSILVFALAMSGAMAGPLNKAILLVYQAMYPIAYGGFQVYRLLTGA